MPKREKFAEPWKEWSESWKEITHPSRPCQKNLRDYKRFFVQAVKGRKYPNVLMFGATPELRDLLAKYPTVETTIVDINMEMILAMTELMQYKEKASEEIWVKADWLRAPLKEGYYDVLFGDYILENLPYKKQSKFFKKCYQLLKKGGCFITRFYAQYPGCKEPDFKELLREYSKKKFDLQNFENFWTRATFYSNLRKGRKLNTKFFLEELKKYNKNPTIKQTYKKAKEILPPSKEWTYWNWQKDKWMLEKYFVVGDKAAEPKRSISYNWGYILKLKKK